MRVGGSALRVLLKAPAVVVVKDGAPGVEAEGGRRARDEQHERELHHVADLHQHDGGDEGQHGDVAVILGVLQAAALQLQLRRPVVGSCVVLQTAELDTGTGRGQGQVMSGSERATQLRALPEASEALGGGLPSR